MTATVVLARWFFTPTSSYNDVSERGPVRIWGFTESNETKIWRSSSIVARNSPNEVVTRYGTVVKLRGNLNATAAKKMELAPWILKGFRAGFPLEWKKLLDKWLESLSKTVERKPAAQRQRVRKRPRKVRMNHVRAIRTRKPAIVMDSPMKTRLTQREQPLSKNDDTAEQNDDDDDASIDQRGSANGNSNAKTPKNKGADDDDMSKEVNDGPLEQGVQPPHPIPRKLRSTNKRARLNYKEVSPDPADLALLGNADETDPKEQNFSSTIDQGKCQIAKAKKKEKCVTHGAPLDKTGRKRVGFCLPEKQDTRRSGHPTDGSPGWSRKQVEAFDRARSTIAAGAVGYWDLVASKVEGKSAEECCHRWERQWNTPKRKSAPSVVVKESTPEIAYQMLQGKINTKTGKYRIKMRRIKAAESRDRDDEDFEPPEVAEINSQSVNPPQTPSLDVQDSCLSSALKMGTPGTEVRATRAAIEHAGSNRTPEILMRGRSWGLAEADRYVAFYKRQLGLSEKNSKATTAKRKKKHAQLKGQAQKLGTPLLGKTGRGRYVAVDDMPGNEGEDSMGSEADSNSDKEFELFF